MLTFRPQHNEAWSQPQEKIWKDHKYMEVKDCPLQNERISQEIKEEIKKEKYMEANENENMTVQNLWDTAKAGSI